MQKLNIIDIFLFKTTLKSIGTFNHPAILKVCLLIFIPNKACKIIHVQGNVKYEQIGVQDYYYNFGRKTILFKHNLYVFKELYIQLYNCESLVTFYRKQVANYNFFVHYDPTKCTLEKMCIFTFLKVPTNLRMVHVDRYTQQFPIYI